MTKLGNSSTRAAMQREVSSYGSTVGVSFRRTSIVVRDGMEQVQILLMDTGWYKPK